MNPKSLKEPAPAKAAAAHPDRELLDLYAALTAADDEARRPGNTNEQTDAAHGRLIDARFRIIDTPAQTVVGLAIKLRVTQVFVDDRLVLPKPGDDRSQHEMDDWAIANVVWDADRLAGQGGTVTPDPAVELAARYVRGCEDFDATEKSNEEGDAFAGWQKSLEGELAKAHPTTLEGVAALLDLVLDAYRDQQGAKLLWMNRYVIALLENARDAVREPGGLSGEGRAGKAPSYLDLTDPAGNDPQREKKSQIDVKIAAAAPDDLWHRWQEIQVEFPARADEPNDVSERRQDLLGHEAGTIEQKILHTQASSVADVLIKMQLAEGLIQMFARDEPQHQEETCNTNERMNGLGVRP